MNFVNLRKKMVEGQLLARGIKHAEVLTAFQKVPRHRFVPQKCLVSAYGDFPLSIGAGQTISQPYIAALMTQQLAPAKKKIVLEIGTGSGYQTAILSELFDKVYSVECIRALAQKAKLRLAGLGRQNITVKIGDGTMGWSEYAPYDGIIVTAAAPEIPPPLLTQLKVGGRLVIPLGASLSQTLTLISKHEGGITTTPICGCIFVPLLGKYGWSKKDV